jgi:hypothetical protein
MEASEPLIVPDAPKNPYFHEEPIVRAGQLRGYAGCPLFDSAGRARGSLSVLSTRAPMPLDLAGLADLSARAGQIGQVLSYLGGARTVPRNESPTNESSVQLTAAAKAAEEAGWTAPGFDEAPTEPGSSVGS